MESHRLDRLGEQIREEISAMVLSGKIKDPRVSSFLSITRVEVSSDLSFAKVYVSGFQGERAVKRGVAGLESAKGFIQSILSKKLRVRQFPKLAFFFDKSVRLGFEMVKKIDSLMASSESSGGETPSKESPLAAKPDAAANLPE